MKTIALALLLSLAACGITREQIEAALVNVDMPPAQREAVIQQLEDSNSVLTGLGYIFGAALSSWAGVRLYRRVTAPQPTN